MRFTVERKKKLLWNFDWKRRKSAKVEFTVFVSDRQALTSNNSAKFVWLETSSENCVFKFLHRKKIISSINERVEHQNVVNVFIAALPFDWLRDCAGDAISSSPIPKMIESYLNNSMFAVCITVERCLPRHRASLSTTKRLPVPSIRLSVGRTDRACVAAAASYLRLAR